MFDDRFARQKRFGPPSGFPLTSTYTGIVHHLSGPNLIALSQTSLKRSKSDDCAKQKNPISYFHYAYKFTTRTLAMEFDSLVRVSRRVEKNHLAIVLQQATRHPSAWRLRNLGLRRLFHTIQTLKTRR